MKTPAPKYRRRLPQLTSPLFMTDGGMETTLIFHDGLNLPAFAAFDLLKDDAGIAYLRKYYDSYTRIALDRGLGIVLETATWRANADWAATLGYDATTLADANRKSVGLLLEIRAEQETPAVPMVISGALGPRRDGYVVDQKMSIDEARRYHATQIDTFAVTDADLVTAFTINYVEEGVGIVLAAREAGMPVVLSFTLETDGKLPSGESLQQAIVRTDELTGGYAAYYMINCAHPTHFATTVREDAAWRRRIRGLRANASRRSHAELESCTDLDAGDPIALGLEYRELMANWPQFNVVGGCCGTDHRHVEAMCRAVEEGRRAAA